ncbi:MAG: hypothetical protein PHD72_04735 [Patescibacteria group bacterium]|nr:hypothetical protein [Patescibacteria group bacterium]
MPLRRIVVDKDDGQTSPFKASTKIEMDSISMGNKKPSCGGTFCQYKDESIGWLMDEKQITCQTNDDCLKGEECRPITGEVFGSTKNTGCEPGPFEFITDFGCPYDDHVVQWRDNSGGKNIDWDYIEGAYGVQDFVCTYQPRVQALDNWGWCTGTCNSEVYKSSAVKGDGCYSEMGGMQGDQCATSKSLPWVKYNGYIVVIPTE